MFLGILCSLSLPSFADLKQGKQNNEPEKLSFYGGRIVPHAKINKTKQISDQKQQELISVQRRGVHPHVQPKTIDNHQSSIEKNKTIIKPQLTVAIETAKVTVNEAVDNAETNASQSKVLTKRSKVELSREELFLAKKAQYYIERNWNPATGLIDSVQGYHRTTLWDIASGIGAILALEKLGLVSAFDSTARLSKTLKTIITMPLYNNKLPNREYSTTSGLASGKLSNTASNGNGWSALDIGRLLIWLEITKHYKPELKPLISLITDKWQLEKAVHKQDLYGELSTKKRQSYRQEGRLGYLQYAAQGYQFIGFDVSSVFTRENTQQISQDNIMLYIDQRNLPFFTSDSYVLQAIELGSPDVWWNQLKPIYQLHKKHYQQTNKLWVFAEDAMNRPPWFSYNNIHIYAQPWLSTTTHGKKIINPQTFSNKIAFAFSVLFDDEFSQQLADTVMKNSLLEQAVPTGIYQDNSHNTAYNINTNSLILVSLWYKLRGNVAIHQRIRDLAHESK